MTDDVPAAGWTLDPDIARKMRLEHVRKLLDREEWSDAAREAEELLDEAPDHLQALEFLARAQVGMMDAEGAILTWQQVLELDPTPRADRLAALAMARFDQCDLVGAAETAREAVRLDASAPEGWFVLGLASERLPGRAVEAAQAFVAAHRLDPERYPFPLQLDSGGWDQAVTTAMMQVDPQLRTVWEDVPLTLVKYPDLEELRKHDPPFSPRVLGMFTGELPQGDQDPWSVKPEGLTLYMQNLARVADLDELVSRIADVLEDEALVWLGEDPESGDDDDDLELEEG